MWRSRASRAALVAVLAVAGFTATAPSLAQDPASLPSGEIVLPVSDLALTEASPDGDVEITESAAGVRATLAADALFPVGRAALLPGAERALGDVARRIGAARPQEVVVEGHTSAAGPAAANEALSLRRAEAVVEALEGILGAAAPGFSPAGRGERDPVSPETAPDGSDDPAGAARNRRVTVTFTR